MIYAIINRLENDQKLTALLHAADEDNRIYPLFSSDKGPCLVYTDSIVSGGAIKENRLEIRIIDDDYDHMTLIEKRLNQLLDLEEDQPGFRYENISILKSSLIGGGTLEDKATHTIERILLFQIKWKERKKA